MTHARPSSLMRRASTASWSVGSTVASSTRSTTSDRRTARRARPTMASSVPLVLALRSIRARRRTPAVSTNRNTVFVFLAVSLLSSLSSSSARATASSMASRVVPATSDTMDRSSPTSRFSSELLPTLGRPTSATEIVVAESSYTAASSASSSRRRRAVAASSRMRARSASIAGSSASRTSATPLPWTAEHASGSPRPSDQKSAAFCASDPTRSHLLTATTAGNARAFFRGPQPP
mmetsp:Transcript_10012/g.40616  ORF Transcript_10012/g.40616 Transcript_10012/m.40616 type:complete len:235 (-) Transcript_10012:164-868(-)